MVFVQCLHEHLDRKLVQRADEGEAGFPPAAESPYPASDSTAPALIRCSKYT